jgi:methylenetetrahydrofolate reductase (NADPH)
MRSRRRVRARAEADQGALADALDRPRYEVLPLPGVEEELARHAPHATVTVTASPRRGITATLETATRLSARGFRVVPHLSARLVADEAHLKEILDELVRTGIGEVFVVAGDVDPPAGTFHESMDLLVAMDRLGYEMAVGIAGYPESHPRISDDVTVQAMWDKRRYASYIVSQVCFDAAVVLRWVRRVRRRGIRLPVLVGVPGPVSTRQLLRVSRRIGVGASARFLSHHGAGMLRLARPGPWRPESLLEPLSPHLAEPGLGIEGLHLYTFNDVAATERWRQATTDRLRTRGGRGG